ncbi:MAG: phosphoribosylformylglycinamidine synthase [Oscillospiraceae bacterium]|nr:phosphoribosylformylglycinamidine synthase [Oscillospiraceae bacterium]
MTKPFRYYAEKKTGFDFSAKAVESELTKALGLSNLSVRLFDCYDLTFADDLTDEKRSQLEQTVLHNPTTDILYSDKLPDLPDTFHLFGIEPVTGQFDAIADSLEQNIQMLTLGERPTVKTGMFYAIDGLNDSDFTRAKAYLVNPLEYRFTELNQNPDTPSQNQQTDIADIPEVDFAELSQMGLAMSEDDITVVKEYFESEGRKPTLTEILALDTYWSDHCRHTTFNTIINDDSLKIEDQRVKSAYELFKSLNSQKGKRPTTLMNIATAAMRHFKNSGELPMLDESDEVNACTIKLEKGEAAGKYLFFKNETHNHPTEIEPFGGASTCIGGGIRDPLSGRAQVYQGMRITGAGDPRQPVEETLSGKLPQRRLTRTAAEGFSSYSNQVGLSSGFSKEIYHPGYVAKRMEAGGLVASADMKNVRREKPLPGDLVLLLGDRTGRDGVGGATGSSVSHDVNTVTVAACEVQKGNPQAGRKLGRLFRKPEATLLIKKCNDFGAGGVSVAVGELADGLEINLDKVPLKYEGLNGTEIAISESQERMAVVIAESDLSAMLKLCDAENVEATVIAQVTEQPRLVMYWRGKKIVDIARSFLDSSGAKRYTSVRVPTVPPSEHKKTVPDLSVCSQKGLTEIFDSSVGGLNVFAPLGGKYALSEIQVMAAIIPGTKSAASIMSYGFDPYALESDPFGGAVSAIVTSVAKLVAVGVDLDTVHLSLQEFFPRCDSPEKWGLPFAAMLGAFSAQVGLKIAAIGGKDSMSGSFGDLDVPPTLISFAVGVGDAKTLLSPEFKKAGSPVYVLPLEPDCDSLPDYSSIKTNWTKYGELVQSGKVLSACVCEHNTFITIRNMAVGNKIGFIGEETSYPVGSIIFEASEQLDGYTLIGNTQEAPEINGDSIDEIIREWESPLESVFPIVKSPADRQSRSHCDSCSASNATTTNKPVIVGNKKAKAVIPVFPGTNGEYDVSFALEQAGGVAETVLIRNLTPTMLNESLAALQKSISDSQMLVFPGGDFGGIVALFQNPELLESLQELLRRNGLILGINEGFKALLRLGLFGADLSATFTSDSGGKHLHRYVPVRVDSNASPWLSCCEVGEIYVQPVSASEKLLVPTSDIPQAQIAFRYADSNEIEAITSPDGRVLGKIAHFERYREFTAKNLPGNKFLPLFEGGIKSL